jgi:hypothetical protein
MGTGSPRSAFAGLSASSFTPTSASLRAWQWRSPEREPSHSRLRDRSPPEVAPGPPRWSGRILRPVLAPSG